VRRYELKIEILDHAYVDSLIVALARQGYAPYIHIDENVICVTVSEEELKELL